MWKCSPSAISATPTSSRNDSASILTVGWVLTKLPTGSAASSITIIAITTAAIITGSSSVMPTAVMIEFEREHHVEEDDLDDRDEEGDGADAVPSSCPSSMWWVSIVPLTIRNRPPPTSTMSRQESAKPAMVTTAR